MCKIKSKKNYNKKMARSVSRKSTKKCPAGQHGRKSHMRAGKRVKAQCVKNRTRTMKRSMKSLTMTAPRKSSKKSASRSRAPKRVLGTGPCTSRTIRDCTKDSRCQVKRRPKGGRTCAFTKGSGIVNREAMNLAGLADA